MDLFEHLDYIVEVLDSIVGVYLVKLRVWKRVRENIQIMNNIGGGARIYIYSNGSGLFVVATAKIKKSFHGIDSLAV